MGERTPADFFEGYPDAWHLYQTLQSTIAELGPYSAKVGRSQIAFRRKTGFAYAWMPMRWLAQPQAPLVLSLAMRSRLDSPRFKEVIEPVTGHWMHHLELHEHSDLDGEVASWLREAYEQAG